MSVQISSGINIGGSEFADSSKNVSAANVTLTGELRGPAAMVIDPATVGDDTGAVTIKGSLTVNSGITLSPGTNVDQITTSNVTLTLSSTWQDTGISGVSLATGTYYIQIYADDSSVNGGHVTTYYSGVIGWFSGSTTENSSDEIILNRAGAAEGSGALYIRILRTNGGTNKIQIAGQTTNNGASTYVFKFRRLI